ncbi:MAG: YcaO-like family protein [Methylobacteriaceae bacterium]|nr:YcaO-like family protein [Methylobacteriaceae bacterium]
MSLRSGCLRPGPPKCYRQGTHRTLEPQETLRRAAAHFERFGITRMAVITGLDRIGIPVALAVRPAARSVAVSAGKGFDLTAAKASAAMEAIECAHAEDIALPLIFGSPEEIAADHRIPDMAALASGGQKLGRFLWIEAEDLLKEGTAWLPYQLVHAHYARPHLPNAHRFRATTNGLASGNTLAEAVCHGLCEVIERDACTRWQRLPPPAREARALALESIRDEGLRELLGRLATARFRVAAWDVTSDIAVSVFHCAIIDDEAPDGQPGTGSGCHLDPTVALTRALLEAVQVRGVYISGARDDIRRRDYSAVYLELFRRNFDRSLRRGDRGIDFSAIPSGALETVEQDIGAVLAKLAAAGFGSVFAINLSHADVGIPVVRVVVPGLENSADEDVDLDPWTRTPGLALS